MGNGSGKTGCSHPALIYALVTPSGSGAVPHYSLLLVSTSSASVHAFCIASCSLNISTNINLPVYFPPYVYTVINLITFACAATQATTTAKVLRFLDLQPYSLPCVLMIWSIAPCKGDLISMLFKQLLHDRNLVCTLYPRLCKTTFFVLPCTLLYLTKFLRVLAICLTFLALKIFTRT